MSGLFDMLPKVGTGHHEPVRAEDDTYLKIAEICRGRAAKTLSGQRHNQIIADHRYKIWIKSKSIKDFARRAYISETTARKLDKQWANITGRDTLTKYQRLSTKDFLKKLDRRIDQSIL
jgi:hypothetical protein